ncbi:hypothetical protein MTO96_024480 [Rhipicephalus appendiculatus]
MCSDFVPKGHRETRPDVLTRPDSTGRRRRASPRRHSAVVASEGRAAKVAKASSRLCDSLSWRRLFAWPISTKEGHG